MKFIFLLLVYFSGFATAVYFLAPAPEQQDIQSDTQNIDYSGFDTQQFVKSFNLGLHKCIYFGKEAALQTAQLIREKLQQRQNQTED